MGGDGGSIAGRADVVRTKGFGFKRNLGGMGYDPNTLVRVGDGSLSDEELAKRIWSTCRLTQKPLSPPIMVDKEGFFYNKEAILEALLHNSLSEDLKIKSIKDLKQIVPPIKEKTFSLFPIWNNKVKGNGTDGLIQCPISGKAGSGFANFEIAWKCGCIFSIKSAKETALDYKKKEICPVCQNHNSKWVPAVPNNSDKQKVKKKRKI